MKNNIFNFYKARYTNFYYSFIHSYIYLFWREGAGRQVENKEEKGARKCSIRLVHAPNVCNIQCVAKLNLEVRYSIQASQMGGKGLTTCGILAAYQKAH